MDTKIETKWNSVVSEIECSLLGYWDVRRGDLHMKKLNVLFNDVIAICKYNSSLKSQLEKYTIVYNNCYQRWSQSKLSRSERKLMDEETLIQNEINNSQIKILMNQELRAQLYIAKNPILSFTIEKSGGIIFLECEKGLEEIKGYIEAKIYIVDSKKFSDDDAKTYAKFIEIASQFQ